MDSATLQGWRARTSWFELRTLCALCIHLSDGVQVVSPSGHDVLTVPYKQAVRVPPDAGCTARHLKVLREALTAPRCTSSADLRERVAEHSHQPAVQGDTLHHWCSGSSLVPPCSAAGALDVPRLPASLRSRPCPRGSSRRHVWVDYAGLGHDLKNPSTTVDAEFRALSGYGRADVRRTSAGRSSGPSVTRNFYRAHPVGG